MKRSKSIYFLIAALLIMATFGMYGCSTNEAKEASIFPIPNFDNSTNIKPAGNAAFNTLQGISNALAQIAQQSIPSVVTIHIQGTKKIKRARNPFGFFNFFGRPRFQRPKIEHYKALGSGVIVSSDGYILTNYHVIRGANQIRVTLSNHKDFEATVVGSDPWTDIAVIKIDANNLPAIEMGNSQKLKVGSLVMAIGSPEAFSQTVTLGIVSAKHRQINLIKHGNGFENYIQTDAAINPGNSGGALVNMSGKLVGINAAIYSKTGGYMGIGFAVPINLAKRIMKQIIKNGKVVHAVLGIYGTNVTQALAKGLGLENIKGILINSVREGSPADKAGLKKGDVIKTVDGKPVGGYWDFQTRIATSKPGRKITLGIVRNGNKMKVHVKLGKRQLQSENPTNSSNKSIRERLGFQVHKLTGRIKQQLNLQPNQQGVLVTEVFRSTRAYRSGLREGDVITSINREKIEDMSDFNDAINDLKNEKHPTILLQVINRAGIHQYIAFTL